MYLLDTNHCSYILEEQPNVLTNLQQRADSRFAGAWKSNDLNHFRPKGAIAGNGDR